MEQVRQAVADYQWWIYAVLGALLLFYLWRALAARREGARSIFKLEQEQARIRYSRNVTVMVVLLILMAVVFVLSNPVLLSFTPEPTAAPTPTETAGPLVEPTLTYTPPPPTITPTPQPTRTRRPRPSRPTPTADTETTPTPVVHPPNCPNPGVRITAPGVNQVIRGNFAVRGAANTANFQYYKIEVGQGPNPQHWTVVGQLHYAPVTGGVLETFNSNAYPPGVYTLRLVVVDQTGNYPDPCRVTVTVQH